MDLGEKFRLHKTDNRVVFAALTVLLAVFVGILYLLQRGKGLPEGVLANRVLFFALWYVNVILILTILFILFRTVFRILVDRERSKFKTKLVVSAIGLSLIPVLIPFPFATSILVDIFDQWFSLPIEDVVAQAAATAQALVDHIESTNLRDAGRLLEDSKDYDLEDLNGTVRLVRHMQELRRQLEVHYLAIFDGTQSIYAIADPRVLRRDPKFGTLNRFLEEAMEKGEAFHIETSPEIDGRLILAARAARREGHVAADPDFDGPPAPSYTVVVAGRVLPRDIAEKQRQLIQTYQAYLQVKAQKEDLRMSYLLILLMVTLLVVLAFSSIGLRLARRVTEPLQELAEATRRVSSGDLEHRVDLAVDDELGVLVDAFNSMTEELQRNKLLVDRRSRELLEATKRIRAVLQNVAAGVLSIDASGKIRTCNGAALRMLSQTEEEVMGEPVVEAWDDPERGKLLGVLNQKMEAGDLATAEVRLVVGGVWKTLEVKVTVLPSTGDAPGGRVMVLEDLTELIHAQKMATWTEVARRIAHEIKNPLTPIKLTAERLLRKHQQGDSQLGNLLEEGCEVIVREVGTLKNMVDEFSRYARMPRPQPQPIDLEKFVQETVGLYRGVKPGVEVKSCVEPQAAETSFDPDQLKSVLTNLLDNAVASTEPPGEVVVSTARSNGALLLRVADTGKGVRPEDKDKIFLPYFSTKGRGTGLGLAIVQRIVAEHHARIRVEDNRPKGAVFTLEIPLH